MAYIGLGGNGERTSIYKLLINPSKNYDLWRAFRLGIPAYWMPDEKFLTSASKVSGTYSHSVPILKLLWKIIDGNEKNSRAILNSSPA